MCAALSTISNRYHYPVPPHMATTIRVPSGARRNLGSQLSINRLPLRRSPPLDHVWLYFSWKITAASRCRVRQRDRPISGIMAGRFSFVTFSALVLVGWAESHSLGWGSCSNIKGMAGFDKNQFLGKWYINEVFSAINSCMTLTFEAKPDVDNELRMSQGRQLAVVGSTTTYVGTVIIGDPVPSEMLIEWPATGWLIGSQKYTVVDTDYATYALTYECRNVGPIRYYSSTILTRQPTVDPTVMAEIKKKAADAGIRVSDYVKIDQVNCAASDSSTPNTAAYNHYGLVSDEKLVTIKNNEALLKEIGWVKLHR